MNAEKKLTMLNRLLRKRNTMQEKVGQLDKQIARLMKQKTTQIKTRPPRKLNCPPPGSGPEKLCKVMSSRPKQVEDIARRLKLTVGTVKQYIQKYDCFQSAGYGRGYICVLPDAAKTKKAKKTKKSKKAKKTRKSPHSKKK